MDQLNEFIGAAVAEPTNPGTVGIKVPKKYGGNIVQLLTEIEQLRVDPDQPAKVVIDEQSGIIVGRQSELSGRRATIEESRKKAAELAAKSKELEYVVLNRSNWPAFLGDLQARVGTLKNTWVEEMHVKYETLPAAPAVEGQPAPAPVVITKVVVSVRFLFTEVPYEMKQYRSAAEKAHIGRLLEAVRKSPYVSAVPESDIVVTDQNTVRTPKATITLVIHKDKAL
jgi:hypothetical protein